jgi:cobalamin biosynthesis protein CobD/CbiB
MMLLSSEAIASVPLGEPVMSAKRMLGIVSRELSLSAKFGDPLTPRLYGGIPWVALCVGTGLAALTMGHVMVVLFVLTLFLGLASLVALRVLERSIQVLHLVARYREEH